MKIKHKLKDSQQKQATSICLGVFDGVHRGHQAILGSAKRYAKRHGIKCLAVTLSPHPQSVLKPSKPLQMIQSLESRLKIFEECGVDEAIVLPFTKGFSQMTAQNFVKNILIKKLKASYIAVGPNFHFGKGAEGNGHMLQEHAHALGYTLHVVAAKKMSKALISSSRIRQWIHQANFKQAQKALGHTFTIQGQSTTGMGQGKRMGYPTINLKMASHQLMPKHGVFAGRIAMNNTTHSCVIHWGPKPTFKMKSESLEVHVLTKELGRIRKNQTCSLTFIKHIRPIKRFASVTQLRTQIQEDIRGV